MKCISKTRIIKVRGFLLLWNITNLFLYSACNCGINFFFYRCGINLCRCTASKIYVALAPHLKKIKIWCMFITLLHDIIYKLNTLIQPYKKPNFSWKKVKKNLMEIYSYCKIVLHFFLKKSFTLLFNRGRYHITM
jgi:hypothetical protein